MNKDLSELTIIRLQTEMENCLGFMAHAQKTNNLVEYIVYENELNNILKEIETLGE